ncbi:hypothetical protein BDF20DRAFT_856562 [Mycotypha africana]|uniref:uncharacterized protein n=1 Tax=Mycotypha africana TaxID=64632 RepID=UPI0022FFF990|nr:uncharacterized protein BDF20DRAFT_856562 [Mycotypha africana]KAI8988586.1 hypothetical protein BDF20DRAFT_856562 [Mycotypha africana]
MKSFSVLAFALFFVAAVFAAPSPNPDDGDHGVTQAIGTVGAGSDNGNGVLGNLLGAGLLNNNQNDNKVGQNAQIHTDD